MELTRRAAFGVLILISLCFELCRPFEFLKRHKSPELDLVAFMASVLKVSSNVERLTSEMDYVEGLRRSQGAQ
jgi:hypothetical protein